MSELQQHTHTALASQWTQLCGDYSVVSARQNVAQQDKQQALLQGSASLEATL